MDDSTKYHLFLIDDGRYKTQLTEKFKKRTPYTPKDPSKVTAVIPGTIVKLQIKEGQQVNPGRCLLILEAMKMKNRIFSEIPGKILKIHVKEGDIVTKNQLLLEYKKEVTETKVPTEKKSREKRRLRKRGTGKNRESNEVE